MSPYQADLTVRQRITLSFVGFTLLALLALGTNIGLQRHAQLNDHRLIDGNLDELIQGTELRYALQCAQIAVQNVLLLQNSPTDVQQQAHEHALNVLQTLQQTTHTWLTATRNDDDSALPQITHREQQQASQLGQQLQQWQQEGLKLLHAATFNNNDYLNWLKALEPQQKQLQMLYTLQTQELQLQHQHFSDQLHTVYRFTLFAALFLPVMALLTSYLLSHLILSPLQHLGRYAQTLLKERDRDTPLRHRRDEIGQLARSFVGFAEQLGQQEQQLRDELNQRQRSESKLRELFDFNALVLDRVTDALLVINEKMEIGFVNQSLCQLVGCRAEQLLEQAWPATWLPLLQTAGGQLNDWLAALQDGRLSEVTSITPLCLKNGKIPVELYLAPLEVHDGRTLLLLMLRDRREQQQHELRRHLTERVFDNIHEAIVITDSQRRITEVNQAFTQITGVPREQAIGRDPGFLKSGRHPREFYQRMWQEIDETGHWSGEIWDRRLNGEVYPKWMTLFTLGDATGEVNHYVAVFSDITHQKAQEEQLFELAFYDPLTHLPNRRLWRDRLQQSIVEAAIHHELIGVLFLDLDHFKAVNDSLGHTCGDQLLQTLAERLQQELHPEDTLARLGGDEFSIILPARRSSSEISEIAERLLRRIAEPITLEGITITPCASIGIAQYPCDGESPESLSRNADAAMYLAKERGRNQWQFYQPEINASAMERLQLSTDLQQAIVQGHQLSLHYQPKVDAQSGSIVGVEALVRWRHPLHGMIPPTQFIPLAEQHGLIGKLSEWIIETACHEIATLNQRLPQPLQVAVNLSALQLSDLELPRHLDRTLQRTGLSHTLLEVEVTEGMLIDNMQQACALLEQIRQLGIRVALDDFGTGYSSLSYLQQIPLDTLKVDRSFVQALDDNPATASIVRAISDLSRGLQLTLVAEGVETHSQWERLREYDCELIQGYLFYPPLPLPKLQAVLQTNLELTHGELQPLA